MKYLGWPYWLVALAPSYSITLLIIITTFNSKKTKHGLPVSELIRLQSQLQQDNVQLPIILNISPQECTLQISTILAWSETILGICIRNFEMFRVIGYTCCYCCCCCCCGCCCAGFDAGEGWRLSAVTELPALRKAETAGLLMELEEPVMGVLEGKGDGRERGQPFGVCGWSNPSFALPVFLLLFRNRSLKTLLFNATGFACALAHNLSCDCSSLGIS